MYRLPVYVVTEHDHEEGTVGVLGPFFTIEKAKAAILAAFDAIAYDEYHNDGVTDDGMCGWAGNVEDGEGVTEWTIHERTMS